MASDLVESVLFVAYFIAPFVAAVLVALLILHGIASLVARFVIRSMQKEPKTDIPAEPFGPVNQDRHSPVGELKIDEISSVTLQTNERRCFAHAKRTAFTTLTLSLVGLVLAQLTAWCLLFDRNHQYLISYLIFVAASLFFVLVVMLAQVVSYWLIRELHWWTIGGTGFWLLIVNVIATVWLKRSVAIGLLIPIIYAGFVLLTYRSMRRKTKSLGNRKLLILRIFDVNRNTEWTFRRVMRFWRYVGTFMTVVDRTYARLEYRMTHPSLIWKTLVFLFILILSVAAVFGAVFATTTFMQDMDHIGENGQELNDFYTGLIFRGMAIGALALAVVGAIICLYVSIRIRFIAKKRQLKRIEKRIRAAKVRFNGSRKGWPMFCHNNTWKYTVKQCADLADVILMDLRGYSDAREGVKYEVA